MNPLRTALVGSAIVACGVIGLDACSSSATDSAGGSGGSTVDAAADQGLAGSTQSGGASGSGGGGGDGASGGASSGGASSGGSSGSGGAGASGGGAGSSSGGAGTDAGYPDVTFGYDAAEPDADACAATTVQAEQVPLDMYVMMDISGSMLETVQSGATKWDTMKSAFTAFVQDGQSAGLGVGIEYFSQRPAGVPASCSSHVQCGAAAPCVISACANNINAVCVSNANCFPFQCVPRGYCSNDANIHCIPVGGTACGAGNQCLALTTSFCFGQDSCVASDYATPAVPIAPLPGNAGALVTSINAQVPFSATPTSAALQGAVDHARSWATANPTHEVIVLFATDGVPTRCNTNIAQIAQIAGTALSGTPSIRTYVLGVFTPAEAAAAQANLDQIASSGGSGTAFVVSTTGNVTQALIDAMNTIRGSALSCEYFMPTTDAGIIDPDTVAVVFDDGSGPQTISRQTTAGACGAGWYYDNNTAPTKITLCPSTCMAAQNVSNARVDIELGCLGS